MNRQAKHFAAIVACPSGLLTGGYMASPSATPKFAIANFTYPQNVIPTIS